MESNFDYEIDLEKFGGSLVCMYDKERDVIIYWEPIYNGFRGTCESCPNNWHTWITVQSTILHLLPCKLYPDSEYRRAMTVMIAKLIL